MRIANTPDSTSNSEGDRFCRLNHKRRGRRRGLFDVNEPAGTNRRADANGSRSLQSRNHTHYVAGSVVETNIHYPTDSDLLGDGARVLTRTMQKVEKAAGGLKKRIRNRMRSVNKKVIAIALAGRLKGPEGEERRVERYRELVSLTRKIVHQAEGVLEEMQHLPRRRQAQLKRFREILETMAGRVRQVVRQTKARVFQGITKYPHKVVSLFEPHTEIIRKGKQASQTSSGNWLKCRKPRTKSSRTMKCSPNVQRIPNYWLPRSNNTSDDSGAYREWWPPTRGSTV